MAATVATINKFKFGNGYCVIADITLDDSYPTGGEGVTAAKFGLEVINFLVPAASGGYVFQFDHTNKKLLAYNQDTDGGPLVEVTNTTDLHTIVVRVMVLGY